MRRVVSCFLCLALAAAAVTTLACLLPTRPGRPEADTWNPARLLTALAQERQRQAALDEACRAAERCRAARRAVVAEVVAGRLGLAEAAERFRLIDSAAPGPGVRALRQTVPGASDEERYSRSVLMHVEANLATQGVARGPVLDGLRAQLGARFPCGRG